MNYIRILRVTNILLITCGFQLTWFEKKTRHYRLSIGAVVHFVLLTICYVMCFSQHFEKSAFLKMLQDVSPFLQSLMRMHLLVGCKLYIFGLYESKSVTHAANGLAEQFPRIFAHKFQREEGYSYVLLFSSLVVGLIHGIYIAYEMDFKLPPLEHILIFGALFVPHLVIAGSLRCYNIGHWLAAQQLENLAGRIADDHAAKLFPSEKHVAALEIEDAPTKYENELETLSVRLNGFSKALQRQISSLFLLNFNCLLGGVYANVYYRNIWYVIFQSCYKRVFYAANSAIFTCIACDYLCLLLTQSYFEKVRTKFLNNLNVTLYGGEPPSQSTCSTLKKFRAILHDNYHFKFFGIWRLNILNFLLLHTLMVLTIAICVAYQYLNDQIVTIVARLDSLDNEE